MQANSEMVRVLSLNEEYDKAENKRISENKEVDALLLAIDKWCFWNPYFGVENCPEDFDEAVTSKYSFSTSGIGNPSYSIDPFILSFGAKQ